MKDRASTTSPHATRVRTGAHSPTGSATVTLTIPSFVQDKKKLTIVAGALGLVVLILGVLVATKKPPGDAQLAAAPATEPAKGAEPAKPAAPLPTPPGPAPESKVVSPAPTTSVIPAPAPAPAEPAKPAAAEPKAPAPKTEPAKPAAPATGAPASGAPAGGTQVAAAPAAAASANPSVIPATLVFAVQPWGEIFVNGKSQGVTPPKKSIKLDPGKYKIEIRNTTFPAHVENLDLKARDEVTVRHRFQ